MKHDLNEIMSSKKIFISCALMAIPVLLYFWYISTYGVNVLFWDEWDEYIPFYDKLQSGTLSFADLFAQHNEHRLFFPKIIFLILGDISNFNTVVNMYLSALLLVFTLAIIFHSYIRFFGFSEKSLLGFLPVPYLLFSFVQFENTLWGFQIAWYILILFSVLSFAFLENIKRGYVFLVFAIISGVLASYSSLHGLLVWPVGIVYFIFRGISEKDNRLFWLKMTLSWIVIALLVVSLYFVNYYQPSSHPIFFIFLHPVDGLKHFLSLISAIVPIGYLSILGTIVLGSLLLAFYFYVILRVFKLRSNSVFYLPILLIFFSLFFNIITTVGRSGLGIGSAFFSRYTSFNILGVIGIYLSLLTIIEVVQKQKLEEKEGQLELKRNKIFSAKSNYATLSINVKKRANKMDSICLIILLLIFLLQISLSYPYGLESGENIKTQRTEGAYALLNYEIASDNTIEKTLYPGAERLKELAPICEKYKLNVFSNPPNSAYFPANLALSSEPSLCDISLNGISIHQQKQPLFINAAKEKEIVTEGWAVDKEASDIALAVFITIDDEIEIPTIYGIDRNDVSKYYKNVKYRYSGYQASFSTSSIEEGEHTIYLKIISNDGARYFKSAEVKFYIEHITAAEGCGIVFSDGHWYVDTNMDQIADLVFVYGTAGDIPLIGDFNKDGKGDTAIFNNGLWSVDTTRDLVADLIFAYGFAGGTPLVGDFDQDGEDDIAIVSLPTWFVDTTGDHLADLVFDYGFTGATPLVGDIDQDGTDDIAVVSLHTWFVDTDMSRTADLVFGYEFAGGTPLVGDINQDGKDDIAVVSLPAWFVDTDMSRTADLVFDYGFAGATPLVGTSTRMEQMT
jgi:hypothetical protein